MKMYNTKVEHVGPELSDLQEFKKFHAIHQLMKNQIWQKMKARTITHTHTLMVGTT